MVGKPPIEFEAAPFVVKACWIAPGAVEDFSVVRTTAQMLHNARAASNKQLKNGGRSLADTHGELGRILFRSGAFDKAAQQLEEALKLHSADDFPTFFNLAFHAMAQQRLGHAEEAARRWAEAQRVVDKAAAPGSPRAAWDFRVAAGRLRTEAAALLEPAHATTKPEKS